MQIAKQDSIGGLYGARGWRKTCIHRAVFKQERCLRLLQGARGMS